ncbi:MAG: TetR/AcrR family transcriptional regulator [Bacteroidia bacterium]|nr:TetR/AcrR family transcriptional regulator [Bacteroidia bacterium]
MSTLERRQRDKERLYELILEHALALYAEQGYEGTTMRKLAAHIDYSVGAIYPYFSDKDEIFYALHVKGFERLFEAFKLPMAEPDPWQRLYSLGQAYVRFALENAALYDIMFLMSNTGARIRALIEAEEAWLQGQNAYTVLRDTVSECLATGKLAPGDPDQVAFVFWSAVHGMVSIFIRNRMVVIDTDKHTELIAKSYSYLMQQMAHTPT